MDRKYDALLKDGNRNNGEKYGLKENVLEQLRAVASKCNIEKIILFGSRARGDYKERSDIDLACTGGKVECFAWDVEEEVDTLLGFDIINLDTAVQPELLESINREGIVIYEKIREFCASSK